MSVSVALWRFPTNLVNFSFSSKFSSKVGFYISFFSDNSCTTISTEAKLTDKSQSLDSSSGFGIGIQQNVEVRRPKQDFCFVFDTCLMSGDHDQDYDSYLYQLPVRCKNHLESCVKTNI